MSRSSFRLRTAARRNNSEPPVTTGPNLLVGKTFGGTSGDQSPIGNMTDQNASTRWISASQDTVAPVADLGAVFVLGKVVIIWAGDTTNHYAVDVSIDSATWTTVYTGQTSGTSPETATITSFAAVARGRYLRIRCIDRQANATTSGWGNSIWEVEAYGSRDTNYATGTVSNLTANVTTSSVTLNWAYAGDPLTNYIVKRNGTTVSTITNTSTMTYTDSSVTLGSSYTYTVQGTLVSGGVSTNVATITATVQDPNAAIFSTSTTKKIMFVGDSITFGIGGESTAGWRGPLTQKMQSKGWLLTQVGTQNYPSAMGTGNHTGHSGWSCNNLMNGNGSGSPGGTIATWLQTHQPDIITLHIGTNDFGLEQNSVSQAVADFNALLASMVNAAPNAVYFVAGIINYPNWRDQRIIDYDAAVNSTVNNYKAQGKRMYFVNLEHTLQSNQAYYADGVHPNTAGYALMANVWFDAFVAANGG